MNIEINEGSQVSLGISNSSNLEHVKIKSNNNNDILTQNKKNISSSILDVLLSTLKIYTTDTIINVLTKIMEKSDVKQNHTNETQVTLIEKEKTKQREIECNMLITIEKERTKQISKMLQIVENKRTISKL